MLAIVMNNRPIDSKLADSLLSSIQSKMDKAQAKDIFYICVALGGRQQRIPSKTIHSDLYYTLYLRLTSIIEDFDLYQLSKIGMFLSNPDAIKYVPEEFWKSQFESALIDSIKEFKKHSDLIQKEAYFEDFTSCLLSFGFSQQGIISN